MDQPSLEEQWRRKFLDEGFDDVFIWRDGPNVVYPDHSHPFTSSHVILEGEMTVVTEDHGQILKPGDRMDVIKGTIHTVKIGKDGCRYVIAQRYGF